MNKLMQDAAINPNYAGAEMAVEPTFAIEGVVGRVRNLTDRVHKMSARMNDNADRVFGTAPEVTDGSKVGAPPSGSVHLLREAIASLSDALDSAEAAASRFDYL